MTQWRRRTTITVDCRSWCGDGQGRRATPFHAWQAWTLRLEYRGPYGRGWEGFVDVLYGRTDARGRSQRAWWAQLGRIEDVTGTIDAWERLCT